RIIVETVGVGQSEHHVSQVVDLVVFLTMAGSGDSLQGIKRGILETVDLVAVNKADGNGLAAAKEHARELKGALELLRGKEAPECVPTSALSGLGIDVLSELVDRLLHQRTDDGSLLERRSVQRRQWFEAAIVDHLQRRLQARPDWGTHHEALLDKVVSGATAPYAAARELLDRLGL
ncbi:MAG: methylmalonyl Co-A mutase-associated GTPase MeaB, partial [Rhodothermales bacterium]